MEYINMQNIRFNDNLLRIDDLQPFNEIKNVNITLFSELNYFKKMEFLNQFLKYEIINLDYELKKFNQIGLSYVYNIIKNNVNPQELLHFFIKNNKCLNKEQIISIIIDAMYNFISIKTITNQTLTNRLFNIIDIIIPKSDIILYKKNINYLHIQNLLLTLELNKIVNLIEIRKTLYDNQYQNITQKIKDVEILKLDRLIKNLYENCQNKIQILNSKHKKENLKSIAVSLVSTGLMMTVGYLAGLGVDKLFKIPNKNYSLFGSLVGLGLGISTTTMILTSDKSLNYSTNTINPNALNTSLDSFYKAKQVKKLIAKFDIYEKKIIQKKQMDETLNFLDDLSKSENSIEEEITKQKSSNILI